MKSYELFNSETQALFYNLKAEPIQRMLDFDFLSERKTPSVAGIIHPGKKGFHKAFFGQTEIIIPIYNTIQEAAKDNPKADTIINFASFRSAFESSKEALNTTSIKTIVIIAEGIPERQTRELIAIAKQKSKTIIGPSTVGCIVAGQFRTANIGGTTDNLIRAKLFRPGSVGLVSKSGGITNEMFNILERTTNGINEGIAIGGDAFPGSTLTDHLLRFQENPNIHLLFAFGELGGKEEYNIINAIKEKKITKPLIMYISGTCAAIFPWEVQFGHAGAKAGKEQESAKAKITALKEVGVLIPNTFDDLEPLLKEQFQKISKEKKIQMKDDQPKVNLPLDYSAAVKKGLVRKVTTITTTISNDTGEEPTYGAIPISSIIEKKYSIGDIIGILWFKKKLPQSMSKFLETIIIITADHGPAVSGAHNAIVTARAGKDVIDSLCSGLLTIGPRFGGAIDDACRNFKLKCDNNISPEDFVEDMKRKGIPIPGIGHRIKSKRNPDKRVELLKKFAKENFSSTTYLNYALKVEKVTLQKAENLILNVDGCIGALFLDALISSKSFSKEEIDSIINIGYLNGLFALSRSIGLIGHILDQKRLGAELYRHPTEDILYIK